MFDWQTPGYTEDIVLELRWHDQDQQDRVAQHSPSPTGLDRLSAPRSTWPVAVSPSSMAAGPDFPGAA